MKKFSAWKILGALLFTAGLGTAPATVPNPPSDLRVVPKTVNGRVVALLTWRDNSSDERQFEFHHERWVVNSRHPSGHWAKFGREGIAPRNSTTITNNPTYGGVQKYRYRIRAANLAGPSEWADRAVRPEGWVEVVLRN